jgi:hypothetical protein
LQNPAKKKHNTLILASGAKKKHNTSTAAGAPKSREKNIHVRACHRCAKAKNGDKTQEYGMLQAHQGKKHRKFNNLARRRRAKAEIQAGNGNFARRRRAKMKKIYTWISAHLPCSKKKQVALISGT